MLTNNKIKIINFLATIALLAFVLILFSHMISIGLNETKTTHSTFDFVIIAVIVLLSLILFALNLSLINNNIINEKNSLAIIDQKNEEIENYINKNKRKEVKIENTETLNINTILERLLPTTLKEVETLEKFTEQSLSLLAKELELAQALFFVKKSTSETFEINGLYAYYAETKPENFDTGQGISGQVAKNKEIINITDVPDDYITIQSGLGKSNPTNLVILPLIFKDKTIGIIEMASFKKFDQNHIELFNKFGTETAIILTNLLKENKQPKHD